MSPALLHYTSIGPAGAPVLVLGNSLGTTAGMWDDVAPALAGRFRVLRYDHRGHGGSQTPVGPYSIADLGNDVLSLLDSLGVERFSYCGLSLGGMVGMWLASHAPHRVERLALCCTSAHLPPAEGWLTRAAQVRADGTASVAEAVLGRWFTADWARANPQAVTRIREMLLATPDEGYAACCEAISELDLRPDLAAIRADTLVIAGGVDPATPPEHGAAIAEAVPGARLRVLPGVAHMSAVQAAEPVTALLMEHFDGLPAPATPTVQPSTYHTGMAIRREVLGDAHVTAAQAGTDEFTADFQHLITRYAWGEIWGRPGLDRRARSCVTLAVLATLRCDAELAMHVRAALRNGLTPEEIKEVLLQVAVYAGVPAANSAFAVAQQVLAEARQAERA